MTALRSAINISKLPIRQSTLICFNTCNSRISKLPIRQSTISRSVFDRSHVSKLPIRQSTPDYQTAQNVIVF